MQKSNTKITYSHSENFKVWLLFSRSIYGCQENKFIKKSAFIFMHNEYRVTVSIFSNIVNIKPIPCLLYVWKVDIKSFSEYRESTRKFSCRVAIVSCLVATVFCRVATVSCSVATASYRVAIVSCRIASFLSCCNSFMCCNSFLSCCNSFLSCCNSFLSRCNSFMSCCISFLSCCNSFLLCCNSFLTGCNIFLSCCNSFLSCCNSVLSCCNSFLSLASVSVLGFNSFHYPAAAPLMPYFISYRDVLQQLSIPYCNSFLLLYVCNRTVSITFLNEQSYVSFLTVTLYDNASFTIVRRSLYNKSLSGTFT